MDKNLYKCNFEALRCNKTLNKFMNAFDPSIAGIGIRVKISFKTSTEPTQEYIEKMKHEIENIPNVEWCFRGVAYLGCELLF